MSNQPQSAAGPGGERFRGQLRFPDGSRVDAVLSVDGDELAVTMDGGEVGRWPLDRCRAARDGDAFRLSVDGEDVGFAPGDPERFARVAADRFRGSTLAERIGIMRAASPTDAGTPTSRPRSTGARPAVRPWPRVGRWAGFVASALAAGALAAMLGVGPAGEPPPTLGGSTTTGPVTVPQRSIDAFTLVPEEFAARWNEVAAALGVDERVVGVSGPGGFEARLSDRVLLQGTVGDDGTVDAFVVSVDPAGTGDENRVSLATWGVAIAVAEPALDASARRDLLGELGVDVDDPRAVGIDGAVVRDRRRYSMRYVPEFRTILFAVEER